MGIFFSQDTKSTSHLSTKGKKNKKEDEEREGKNKNDCSLKDTVKRMKI